MLQPSPLSRFIIRYDSLVYPVLAFIDVRIKYMKCHMCDYTVGLYALLLTGTWNTKCITGLLYNPIDTWNDISVTIL